MIYDEGFHVNVGGKEGQHSFIAFSKYMLDNGDSAGSTDNFHNKQHSFCGQTLLGWHRTIDPNTGAITKQQCWWGERIKPLHEALASLPPSLAGPPVGLPPVLPLPVADSSASGKPPKVPAPEPAPGAMPPSANLRGADEETLIGSIRATFSFKDLRNSHPLRHCLQFVVACCLAMTVYGTYRSSLAPSRLAKQKGSGSSVTSWNVVAVGSLAFAVAIAGFLWLVPCAHTLEHQALAAEVAAKSPQAAAAMAAVPIRRDVTKATLGEAADRLHANLKEAKQNGTRVHWQSNPEKFKAWLRERKEKHGMNVHESSSVEDLLDAMSPPRLVGPVGFETEEVIGPVRAVAIKEQLEIANSMGKSASELTTEDVKDGWRVSDTNHHLQRTFQMGGKVLQPNGWRTLVDFDWRNVSLQMPGGKSITNFVNAVPDQGGCGSCYAVAATSMLTSRLMLKYPELHEKFAQSRGADRISVEQQLNCNPFNQGCGGGYPYLVSAWSFGNDLVSQKCVEQSRSTTNRTTSPRGDTQCPKNFNGESCKERFRVSNWRYLGGSLGRCGLHHLCEDAMREELYKGGPLAVSVEPTAGFGYSDGVYHGVAGIQEKGLLYEAAGKKEKTNCTDTECFIWRKVDHSVLLVGWGEDLSQGKTCQPRVHPTVETEVIPDAGCESVKNEQDCAKKSECIFRGYPYWIIQNSYGPGFGREGYLYFGPRGQDPMRVESMTLAADVTWVNREGDMEAKRGSSPSSSSFLASATGHFDFSRSK
jgi:hypothetical protein